MDEGDVVALPVFAEPVGGQGAVTAEQGAEEANAGTVFPDEFAPKALRTRVHDRAAQ